MKAISTWSSLCSALVVSVALTMSASAQSVADKVDARVNAAVQKFQSACGADVQKFCSSVTPGEGRLFFCMLAHEDKISAECDTAIYKGIEQLSNFLDRLEDAAGACMSDIDQYCAHIPPGEGQIAQCLAKNEKSLKSVCKAALGALAAKP